MSTTDTNLQQLVINVGTQAQIDAAIQGGTITADMLSIATDGTDYAEQLASLPTASATEEGKIYQFVGTTGTYTNGYFYKCVSDGQTPATYSWTQINVQPGGGGALPSQTGHNGEFLITDGTDASWSAITFPTVDQTYNSSSTNAQSGVAVAGAISSAISCVYKAAGSVAFASLPVLSSSIEGYVYNITDSFTTTSDFVEGAGNSYPAGTNVVCINTAASGQTAVYKWDVLSALTDLSGYLPTAGGRMTGTLRYVSTGETIGGGIRGNTEGGLEFAKIIESSDSYSGVTIAGLTINGFYPSTNGTKYLGGNNYKWKTLYVTKLNNGGDISVPSTSGTLALTSDIQYVQYSSMPLAYSENANKIVQYTGTTNASYTNGYFYKCTLDESVANVSYSGGGFVNSLQVNKTTFETQTTTTGSYVFTYDGTNWSLGGNTVTLGDYGISYSPIAMIVSGDTITVDYTSAGYHWHNIPTQLPIPDQTGQTSSFLKTNGTNLSWESNVLVNNKDTILGVFAGYGQTLPLIPSGVALGNYATLNSSAGYSIVISNGDVSFYGSSTAAYCTVVGNGKTTASYAIQLGSNSTQQPVNSSANTFKVANSNGNYEMMSADGTIPTDRFTTTPSSNGSYLPTLSISSGTATRSWTSIASSVTSSSTNAEAVGAKLFYDTCGDIETLINAL